MTEQDLTQLPRTRKDALSIGVKYYYTGKPCNAGHIDRRYAPNSTCVKCKSTQDAKFRDGNEELKRKKKEWYLKNHDQIINRKRKYRAENLEKCRQSVRDWAAKYPERAKKSAAESAKKNWGKRLKSHKEWRDRNRDKTRAASASYAKRNKEKVKKMISDWGNANPEKRRAHRLKRIASQKGAAGNFNDTDIKDMYAQQEGKCAACECCINDGYHVDHIIPLALGGSNWPQNLQLLCQKCNCSKGAKPPIDWALANGKKLRRIPVWQGAVQE